MVVLVVVVVEEEEEEGKRLCLLKKAEILERSKMRGYVLEFLENKDFFVVKTSGNAVDHGKNAGRKREGLQKRQRLR